MKPRTAVFLLVLAPIVLAQDSEGKAAPGAVARKGTIRKTISAKGTFAPADPAELKLDLEVFRGGLELTEVKEHGALVNARDIVARLKTDDIDRQVTTERMALDRAELDWADAQAKAREQADSDALRKEAAEREYARTRTKLDGFLKHEKEDNEESERLGIDASKNRLENQKDELDQLEKMYSEDELVDATEEIVLKRSRRSFARAKAYFELNERRRLYRKEFYEAWKEEDLRRDVDAKKRALELTLRSLDVSAKRSKIDLAMKQFGIERAREKFADFEKDRAQFVVRAPRAGMLVHSGAELEKGGSLRAGAVFATIVEPGKLKVETTVAEADILSVKNGLACEVTPTASEDLKAMGRLSVTPLPAKGSFPAEVSIGAVDRQLRPGMTCKVEMILEEARDVVLVPAWAVRDEDGKKLVNTETGGREVKTGISDGKDIVIVEGLQPGERVLKW